MSQVICTQDATRRCMDCGGKVDGTYRVILEVNPVSIQADRKFMYLCYPHYMNRLAAMQERGRALSRSDEARNR